MSDERQAIKQLFGWLGRRPEQPVPSDPRRSLPDAAVENIQPVFWYTSREWEGFGILQPVIVELVATLKQSGYRRFRYSIEVDALRDGADDGPDD